MPNDQAPPADTRSLKNLEEAVLDQRSALEVNLRFRKGTSREQALEEMGLLLAEFYTSQFSASNPYESVTKMEFQISNDRLKSAEYLRLALVGTAYYWVTIPRNTHKKERNVVLGFFNIGPSGMVNFDYKLKFSRAMADLSTRQYREDPVFSREDPKKFCAYANELVKAPATVAAQ